MKFIIIVLFGLSALISVKAQTVNLEQTIANVTAQVSKLNETQLKQQSKADIEKLITFMVEASVQYRKENLSVAANFYDRVEVYLLDSMTKFFAAFDAQAVQDKMVNLIKLTVINEVLVIRTQMEKDMRQKKGSIVASDTSANLEVKYQQIMQKNLDLLKVAIDELTKYHSDFWAGYHKQIFDFLSAENKTITSDLKTLAEAVRAKNLQVLVDDMTLVYEVSNTRTEGTFYEGVSETFSSLVEQAGQTVASLASSVKSVFAKLF